MRRIKISFLFFLVFCLSFFNGCGLEKVYYLITPSVTHHTPSVSSVTDIPAYDLAYFEFTTKDSENNDIGDSSFKFLGTGIYYKIYYNVSTMLSVNSSISAADESSAATQMISTYKYQPLRLETSAPSPLIEAASENQRVYIRLSNYKETVTSDNIAIVRTRKESESSYTDKGVPRRSVGSNGKFYSFDFGRTEQDSELNKVPVRGNSTSDVDADTDVESDSNSYSDENEKLWFIDLYAVSEGRDDTYTTYYSNVLHLGAVCINASSIDN